MYHITFIMNVGFTHWYGVKRNPSIGVSSETAPEFESLLVKSICGDYSLRIPSLREWHTDKSKAIDVIFEEGFPQRYIDETHQLFELYAKAEGVKFRFSEEE